MDSLIQSFEAWITKKIDERLTVQVNTRTTEAAKNKFWEGAVARSLKDINDRVSENEDTINIRVSELEDTINDLDAIDIDSISEQVSDNLVITTR